MAIHFIKKIWSGEIDEQVHSQFIRFSRGKFEDRAVINIKQQGNKIKLGSTFELANDLVLFLAQIEKTFAVSGVLISRENPQHLFKELEISDKADIKKKKNLFRTEINTGLTSEQIKKMALAAHSMLFDMHSQDISLKIKKKLPKPGKGSGKVDDKFCVLELDPRFLPDLHEEFLFDLPRDFKRARISHTFEISQVILPQGEPDFEKIRLKAVRQGRIIRKIEVDGSEKILGKDFKA